MRDAILALLLVVAGLAYEAELVGSFNNYAAQAASCIARNIDTGNLGALRICF